MNRRIPFPFNRILYARTNVIDDLKNVHIQRLQHLTVPLRSFPTGKRKRTGRLLQSLNALRRQVVCRMVRAVAGSKVDKRRLSSGTKLFIIQIQIPVCIKVNHPSARCKDPCPFCKRLFWIFQIPDHIAADDQVKAVCFKW